MKKLFTQINACLQQFHHLGKSTTNQEERHPLAKKAAIRLFLLGGILLTSPVYAEPIPQYKIGYISTEEVLHRLPETKKVEQQLRQLQQKKEVEIETKVAALQQQYEAFAEQRPKLSEKERAQKEEALNKAARDIQHMGEAAQNELMRQQSALYQPLYKKVRQAIEHVGRVNNYSYIFNKDASGMAVILHTHEIYDASELVFKHLGIAPPKKNSKNSDPKKRQNPLPAIGCINIGRIFNLLPETKKVEAEMSDFYKTQRVQIELKEKVFQKKQEAYQKNYATLSNTARQAEEEELKRLQKEIYSAHHDAEKNTEKKRSTLLTPINSRIEKTIQQVALERHYEHIFNRELGEGAHVLLYVEEHDDISDVVLVRLGVKSPAAVSHPTGKKTRIGYTEIESILTSLPDTKKVEKLLEEEYQKLNQELMNTQKDFHQKYETFIKGQSKMTPVAKQKKEDELRKLQQALQDKKAKAEQQFAMKNVEYLQPLYDKVNKAIREVAKEKGYTHIFNKQIEGVALVLYAAPTEDISALVHRKLGIPPPTPSSKL